MKYDKYGYFAERPLRPELWRSVLPDLPLGRVILNNTVPPGFLVIENFLDPNWLDALVRECKEAVGIPHAIGVEGTRATVASDVRSSEQIDVGSLKTDVTGVVRDIFQHIVAPHFNAKIEWFERPEILRYRKGGEYIPHADSENWIDSEQRWKRMIDRDFSMLVYLNDEFDGGEITFSNFGFNLKPSRGLLMAFPSDHRYLHAAQKVMSGVRYALVSWAAIVGGPRADGALTPNIIKM